jgi:hypothetical protein
MVGSLGSQARRRLLLSPISDCRFRCGGWEWVLLIGVCYGDDDDDDNDGTANGLDNHLSFRLARLVLPFVLLFGGDFHLFSD